MFASSPLLMRLYEPAIFGDLAILISVTIIFATVFTLRFEMAIPLPEKDGDAHELVVLSFLTMFGLASVVAICLLIFFHQSIKLFNLQTVNYWIFVLPVTIVLEASINILGFWFIRKSMFLVLALSRTLYIGSMVIFQMIFAPLTHSSQTGLILGFIAGQTFGLVLLLNKYLNREIFSGWRELSLGRIKTQISTYRQFPLFASWNSAFNTIARQIPTVILGLFFTKEIVGQYSIALRMLNMPFNLIGTSVGQVYYQRVSSLIRSKLSIRRFTYTTMAKVGAVIILPLLIIAYSGRFIFTFVLGSEWEMAGIMAEILVPVYLARFISGPVSNIFPATKRQQYMLVWQLALALISILTFYLGGSTGDILFLVRLYSWLTAGLYVVLGVMVVYNARNFDHTRGS